MPDDNVAVSWVRSDDGAVPTGPWFTREVVGRGWQAQTIAASILTSARQVEAAEMEVVVAEPEQGEAGGMGRKELEEENRELRGRAQEDARRLQTVDTQLRQAREDARVAQQRTRGVESELLAALRQQAALTAELERTKQTVAKHEAEAARVAALAAEQNCTQRGAINLQNLGICSSTTGRSTSRAAVKVPAATSRSVLSVLSSARRQDGPRDTVVRVVPAATSRSVLSLLSSARRQDGPRDTVQRLSGQTRHTVVTSRHRAVVGSSSSDDDDDHRRCNDGSLDMRCSENFGCDKYND